MSFRIESLEQRQMLSVAVDLLDAAPHDVWNFPSTNVSLGHQTGEITPFKKTKPVPPVGGNYYGVVYNVYINGMKQPGFNGKANDFSRLTFEFKPGSKRMTGMFTYGKYVNFGLDGSNLRDVPLSGKRMSGSSFKLSGSTDGYNGSPGAADLVVIGTSSADGRRITGTYSVVLHTMAGPDYDFYTKGTFSCKRIKG